MFAFDPASAGVDTGQTDVDRRYPDGRRPAPLGSHEEKKLGKLEGLKCRGGHKLRIVIRDSLSECLRKLQKVLHKI